MFEHQLSFKFNRRIELLIYGAKSSENSFMQTLRSNIDISKE